MLWTLKEEDTLSNAHTWALSPARPFISLLELSIVYQKPGGDGSTAMNLKAHTERSILKCMTG